MGWSDSMGGISDIVSIDFADLAKRFASLLWHYIKIPFIWIAGLPSWCKWLGLGVLLLIALLITWAYFKNKDEWRSVYTT